MKKTLKLNDISRNEDKQLIELDVNQLAPLPPPYDKEEEFPGLQQLTQDQRERMEDNLDGYIALTLPKPKNKEEEKKYIEQFKAGLKKLTGHFYNLYCFLWNTVRSVKHAMTHARFTSPAVKTTFTVLLIVPRSLDD
jgi:hypothetical protein